MEQQPTAEPSGKAEPEEAPGTSDGEDGADEQAAGPSDAAGEDTAQEPPMTKSRAKKLAKQERYQQMKAERRAAEKARRKETKQAQKRQREESFQSLTEEEKQAAKQRAAENREQRKQETQQKAQRMQASLEPGNLRVCIDLDFEQYMKESDQRHLCQQLSYSYSCNVKASKPVHLQLVGLRGGLAALAHKQLPSMAHWHVTRTEQPWADFYKSEIDKVVYLTADSPNEITDLESDKVYVIGGLVDHNKHKGLCYKRACEAGVTTARLPILRYVKLEASTVLTVNHVVQLLIEYHNRRDWASVLDDVLPKRKRADYNAAKSSGALSSEPAENDNEDAGE